MEDVIPGEKITSPEPFTLESANKLNEAWKKVEAKRKVWNEALRKL